MKKSFLLLLVLSTTSISSVFAQDEYSRQEEFRKRTLVIIQFEEFASDVEEFEKEGDTEGLEQYRESLTEYNENMKAAFSEYLQEVPQDYLLTADAMKLSSNELEERVFLTSSIREIEKVDFFIFTFNFLHSKTSKKGKVKLYQDQKSFRVNLQNKVPSKADLFFLCEKVRIYFKYRDEYDRTNLDELLASKTLLIDKETTDMTESDVKAVYPYPFVITTTEEISKAAEGLDANSIYFKLDYDKTRQAIVFVMVDCQTGLAISYSNIGGVSKVSWNGSSNHHRANVAFFGKENGVNPYGGSGYGHVGPEIMRLYTAKVRVKKAMFKYLSSGEKQLKWFNPLNCN